MKPDIQNRADIAQVINSFYDKLLADEVVSFLFTEVAQINLAEHLPILYDFWESVLFHKGNYRRDTMKAHLDLHRQHRLTKVHFDRWLELFNQSVDELFEGDKARLAKERALSIATVIQIKIYNLEKSSIELDS